MIDTNDSFDTEKCHIWHFFFFLPPMERFSL